MVDTGLTYVISTHCPEAGGVRVGFFFDKPNNAIAIGDGKARRGFDSFPVLTAQESWMAFHRGAVDGRFDYDTLDDTFRTASRSPASTLLVRRDSKGIVWLKDRYSSLSYKRFTREEWEALITDIKAGELTIESLLRSVV